MESKSERDRRHFLRAAAGLGAVGLAGGRPLMAGAEKPKKKAVGKEEEEVSPAEDLMREHGVLKRVLLVYGEAARRLDVSEGLPPETLADSAKIIRSFIEDYHEKLEEN